MKQLHITPITQPAKMSCYWKKEWKVIIAIVLTGILFNGSMSIDPILQGVLIDTIIAGSPLQTVILQAALFLGTIVTIQIVRVLKRYYVRVFANRTSASMRMMLYNNVMNRDIHELSKESTGDLMNKAVADVDICVEGMRKVTTEVFDTGVLLFAYLVSMLLYDVRITLISCSFVPVSMLLAQYLKKIIVKYTIAARKQSSTVAASTYDNIGHTMLFRMNGIEGRNRKVYFDELEDLSVKSTKANILENSMQPIYQAVSLLGIAAIFYFGGRKVIDNGWTVGMFTSYLIIFTSLATKASKAAKLFNSYQKANVSWRRIKPYLSTYQTKNRQDTAIASTTVLAVRNLEFAYPDTSELILKAVSFQAKQGDLIGITGSVACGKSTLGVALTGLHPYGGSILLNGKELSAYSQIQRSNRISYLGHAPQLLSDTIFENITLGESGDITQVLHDVCFDTDLQTMPEGIQTKVGSSGVRLSGGQQARIALARALYHKSLILILDDPFSAVDMKTEKQIIETLRNNYHDRIVLLISHRLSIFPNTDAVLFLFENQGVVLGTHETLLKQSKPYRDIYQLQIRGADHEKKPD